MPCHRPTILSRVPLIASLAWFLTAASCSSDRTAITAAPATSPTPRPTLFPPPLVARATPPITPAPLTTTAPPADVARPSASLPTPQPPWDPPQHFPPDLTPILLTGRVEHMPSAKSLECWRAGGGYYYVLIVDAPPNSAHANPARRVILHTSPSFPTPQDFAPFPGRLVQVAMHIDGYTIFTADEEMVAASTDFEYQTPEMPLKLGEKFSVGGGPVVDSIKILADPPAK